VHLTGNDNVENVEVYVKGALNESITRLFESAGRDPVAYFRQNHFGMFLWVKAILELLHSLDVTSDLQKILDNPPRTINDVYQRVLERLSDELNEYELPWIKEIISWSVMSKRDMTLAELQVAILLSKGDHEDAQNARFINIRSTLGKCAAILQVSQGPTYEGQTVSLLHNTFRQFITNTGAQGPVGIARKFLVSKPNTDSKMATACLKYLMRSEIIIDQDRFLPNARRKLLNHRFPLFNYATLFWSGHLTSRATAESQDKVIAQLQVFFQRKALRTWINSVMAYTYNTAQGSLFDPVSWSVTTSLKSSIAWICRSPVTTLKIIVEISKHSPDLWASVKQRAGESTSIDSLFTTWCASVAAELWVVTNPRHWEVSIRCFDIATALSDREFDRPTTFESIVEATAGLAQLACNPDGFNWFVNHSNVYLYNEWHHGVLTLATTVLHSALKIATNPSEKAMALSRLSTVYRNYYQSTSSLDDLNKAIDYETQCLNVAIPIEDPDYEAYLEIAACDLFVRAEITGASSGEAAESSLEDCRKAAKMTIEALHLTLTSHFNLGSDSSNLPAVDTVTFNVLSSLRDQTSEGEGVDLPPGVFRILSTLSYGLSVQQTTTIQVDGDIRDFVKICKNALSCTTEHNPALWTTLGSAYYSFYRAAQSQTTSSVTRNNLKEPKEEKTTISEAGSETPSDPKLEDLNECIDCYRKAISLTPNDHPGLSAMRNNLGRALEMYPGTSPHLNEAIECFRQAVQSTPEDRIDLIAYLYNLAANLRRRKASDNDSKEALLYYRRVVKLAPERHVLLPMSWNNLGHIYYAGEHESDHREAIHCYRMALKYIPKGHRNSAAYANNLANTLKKVAKLPEHYTEAIQYYKLAIDTVHKESHKDTYYSNLAEALLERLYDGDISQVIDCYRKCVELCTGDREKLAGYEMNLGKAFWQRGSLEDLVSAEEWLLKARKDVEKSELRNCLNLLGLTLAKRNDAGDLDEAVDYHREAIKAAEGSKFLSVFESNLGKALVKRDKDLDKAEAVVWFKNAVDHAGENDSAIAQYCSSIGEVYAVDIAKQDDLRKAVMWYRRAVELETEDHNKVAGYLTSLGDTLQNLQQGPESVEVTTMALALTLEDDVSYPLRLMCLATALKNVDWPSNGTHGTNTWKFSFYLTSNQRGIVEAALNVFSEGGSYDNVDEPLAMLQKAWDMYQKVGDEDGIVSCESALVDCIMINYTYHRASSSMSRSTEIFRKFLTLNSRDNKDCRGWDGIRFGALIIKKYCEGLPLLTEDLDLLVEKTEPYREDDDQLRWIVEVVQRLRDYIV
jgi:tetratricopeptide (TPR) repeat protein